VQAAWYGPAGVRVWIDVSNSPQVAVFRPLIALLRERGHDVAVTTRDYAQTLELLEAARIPHEVVGPPHAGASAAGKVRAMAGRLRALRRWARAYRPDVALSHASHELPLTARALGVPASYAYDYEFARAQHGLGSRAATRVLAPEAIPLDRLAALGARPPKLRRYPGLKEEYYLRGVSADPAVPAALGVDPGRALVVVRTPPEVSLYHRHGNPLFAEVLDRLGRDPALHTVVLPRTREQGAALRSAGLPSLIVPEHAVDALSLVAAADLVVSAGGTMNREAVALGVPVYTTFAGRLGAVDEGLIAAGRLRPLTAAGDLVVARRTVRTATEGRDPAALLDLFLGALEA
jgi:predicted glycosyltransferase